MILRDAHQSLLATRMRTEEMLPACEKLNEIGYFAMEVWGGATFDVPIRYLNEDPWDRLKALRQALPDTRLQMLERAMNIVAYWNFPDDVVKKFIHYAKKDGIDIFRIFDALNDLRNMKVPIETVIEEGGHAQGCMSYTISPVHTVDYFVEKFIELEKMGCHSLCVKDMAGMITPQRAYDIIKGVKDAGSKVPMVLHTHCTSGCTEMAYMMACEAGVDVLDTAMSPISGGTAAPATESVVAALQGTKWDTGYDLEKLVEIRKYFLKVWDKYRHLHRINALKCDPEVMVHQIPGGMLSNLIFQLEEQGAGDKYYQILDEVPKVRAELGYPPLVTPTSQVVGVQAVMNVLFGRYKKITKETKDYVKGMYGKSPGPISDEIKALVLGPGWKDEIIDCRPADLIEPMFDKRKKELDEMDLLKKPEDVITYAIYPEVGLKFLKGEAEPEFTSEQLPLPVDHILTQKMVLSQFPELTLDQVKGLGSEGGGGPAAIPTEFNVEVNGEFYEVKLEPTGGFVVAGGGGAPEAKIPKGDVEGGVKCNVQGNVFKVLVKEGDEVSKGDVVAVVEAMKMENDITSEHTGKVEKVFIEVGDTVSPGDNVMVIK